jgi:hypothetical protein
MSALPSPSASVKESALVAVMAGGSGWAKRLKRFVEDACCRSSAFASLCSGAGCGFSASPGCGFVAAESSARGEAGLIEAASVARGVINSRKDSKQALNILRLLREGRGINRFMAFSY